jgi:hypothetical protein
MLWDVVCQVKSGILFIDSNLIKLNSVNTLTSSFFKIHCNIIAPSVTSYLGGLFPSGFQTKMLYLEHD